MANNSAGTFLPTTQVWDVTEIKEVDVTKPEFKELLVRMYQNLNRMAVTINNKESSNYETAETVKGQAFFPNKALDSSTSSTPEHRQVYNKVIDFGALPNATTKSYAHGITLNRGATFTRMYGCTTRQANPNAVHPTFSALPLPYASSTVNNSISIAVNANNLIITTAIDYSDYTTTYVVLEYLKS